MIITLLFIALFMRKLSNNIYCPMRKFFFFLEQAGILRKANKLSIFIKYNKIITHNDSLADLSFSSSISSNTLSPKYNHHTKNNQHLLNFLKTRFHIPNQQHLIQNSRLFNYKFYKMSLQSIADEVKEIIISDSDEAHKDLVHRLMKQLKYVTEETPQYLKMIMESIRKILVDVNQHPSTKLKSHKLIMYLILMGDPQVYECFIQNLLGIFKGNCQYNRNSMYQEKGEDFFKKSKFFMDPNITVQQRNTLKNIGIDYIIFSLELVASLAKWLPYDLQNQTNPSKFSEVYESLVKERVSFPAETNYKFMNSISIKHYQEKIQQIQCEIYSALYSEKGTSSFAQLKIQSENQKQTTFIAKNNQNQSGLPSKNQNTLFNKQESSPSQISSEETKKREAEMAMQKNFFEEIQKTKVKHREMMYKYENKIADMEKQMGEMRGKMEQMQRRSSERYENEMDGKNRIIIDLQKTNHELTSKVRELEAQLQYSRKSFNNSLENQEVSKLRKQNIALKTKILSSCEETSEFQSKKSVKKNMSKTPDSLQFIGYEDARTCFEPFYSNSPSQLKIRLRKALLRQKQLLYKDKVLEVGCITKLESVNSIRLTVVYTNISQKPLFSFLSEFITREDLSVKIINNCRNYLEIGGQTKQEVHVTINQIDFRCLLCSLKYTLDSNQEKTALIMPISKLKLTEPMVYTPPDGSRNNAQLRNNTLNTTNNIYHNTFENSKSTLNKIEKIFKAEKKILPTLHKFKQYYPYALLEKDRTGHETYHLKIQFMGKRFYMEIDEVGSEMRVAVFYENTKLAQAEKFLNEIVFVFSKNY